MFALSSFRRFLYGPDTTIEKIALIESSLENKEELKSEALFRKKDCEYLDEVSNH